MPEMPEVQAHAERLGHSIVGEALQKFQLLNFQALKTFKPQPNEIENARVSKVYRRAKFISIEFDNELSCLLHLMQGGRIRPEPIEKIATKPKLGLVWLIFSAGDETQSWLFTEAGKERKAGVWLIAGDPETQEPLASLGPDADTLTLEALTSLLQKNSKRLHGLLRSQSDIAGVGRLLANEICHAARLSPYANTAKLEPDQILRLHKSMQTLIREFIGFTHVAETFPPGSS